MSDNAPLAVLDPEFFVSFDHRPPGPELRAVAEEVLPSDAWRVVLVRGVWTHVHPRGWKGSGQGWKLHVSTVPRNAGPGVPGARPPVSGGRIAGSRRDSCHPVETVTLSSSCPRGVYRSVLAGIPCQ